MLCEWFSSRVRDKQTPSQGLPVLLGWGDPVGVTRDIHWQHIERVIIFTSAGDLAA